MGGSPSPFFYEFSAVSAHLPFQGYSPFSQHQRTKAEQ
jgi:hypothetical protein